MRRLEEVTTQDHLLQFWDPKDKRLSPDKKDPPEQAAWNFLHFGGTEDSARWRNAGCMRASGYLSLLLLCESRALLREETWMGAIAKGRTEAEPGFLCLSGTLPASVRQ